MSVGAAPRLDARALAALDPARVRLPAHDRALEAATVHIGLGAFARAHVAVYADDLAATGEAAAGVCGVSLRSGRGATDIAEQDGLHTVIQTRSVVPDRFRVIGSVTATAVGAEAAIARLASPATRAVSITVTEAGYLRSPAGGIDLDHPEVRRDLAVLRHGIGTTATPSIPSTMPGVLVAGLARRRAAGLAAPVVISCDNLPANGSVTASVLTSLAAAMDAELADWIERETPFPSTVVDRIVPAPTDADRLLVLEHLGIEDRAAVRAEPHRSWIIEKAPGLPRWDRVGARFVDDVAPWEQRKLRTVNGAHSALAYLGGLAGLVTIDRAAREPGLAAFVTSLIDRDAVPTLAPTAVDPTGPARSAEEVAAAATVLARFADPELGHRCDQVGADGSQKLAQRIVAVAVEQRRAGASVDRPALVLAAWMETVARSTARGTAALRDPLAATLTDLARRCATRAELVDALLGVSSVFGAEAREDPILRTAILRGLQLIEERGPIGAAEAST